MFEKHSIVITRGLLHPGPSRRMHDGGDHDDYLRIGRFRRVAQDSHTQQVMPGQKHKVISCADVMISMTLQQEEQPAILPFYVADKIYVVQVED